MTICDHCGEPTRTIVPVLNMTKDYSPAAAFSPDRPLPRSALEAFGVDLPWGSHPDDDLFENWCERCAQTRKAKDG